MAPNDIANLLDRYLAGNVSPEERERVDNWLQNHTQDQAAWKLLSEQEKEQWVADVFGQIRTTIHAQDERVVVMRPARRLWQRIGAAAAVVIAIATGYALWTGVHTAQPAALTALQVPTHQKKQVMLPDSSTVWVNEGSELQYPQAFSGAAREVYLSGEAYFDIRHDASKPFIIHTGKVSTTVLGTAFNIREDKNLHTVVVTVTRGRVKVSGSKGNFGILTPDQQISVNLLNETAAKKTVDASQTVVWKEDDLHFDNLTFGEVARQLEERYHVPIRFANSKAGRCRFTGTAPSGDSLENILKAICSFNHATYQVAAGAIVIGGPGCN